MEGVIESGKETDLCLHGLDYSGTLLWLPVLQGINLLLHIAIMESTMLGINFTEYDLCSKILRLVGKFWFSFCIIHRLSLSELIEHLSGNFDVKHLHKPILIHDIFNFLILKAKDRFSYGSTKHKAPCKHIKRIHLALEQRFVHTQIKNKNVFARYQIANSGKQAGGTRGAWGAKPKQNPCHSTMVPCNELKLKRDNMESTAKHDCNRSRTIGGCATRIGDQHMAYGRDRMILSGIAVGHLNCCSLHVMWGRVLEYFFCLWLKSRTYSEQSSWLHLNYVRKYMYRIVLNKVPALGQDMIEFQFRFTTQSLFDMNQVYFYQHIVKINFYQNLLIEHVAHIL